MTQKYLDGLTYQVIGATIAVHKELGPGLLEGIYEKCLEYLLKEKGLNIKSQQYANNSKGIGVEVIFLFK